MRYYYMPVEEVGTGDRVLLHGETGKIEIVADPDRDPAPDLGCCSQMIYQGMHRPDAIDSAA